MEGDTWFWDEGQSRIFGVEHDGFVPSMEKMRKCIHPDDLAAFTGRHRIACRRDTPSFDIETRIAPAQWRSALVPAGGARPSLTADGGLIRLSAASPPTSPSARKPTPSRRCWRARWIIAPRTRWLWCRRSSAWRAATTSRNSSSAWKGASMPWPRPMSCFRARAGKAPMCCAWCWRKWRPIRARSRSAFRRSARP